MADPKPPETPPGGAALRYEKARMSRMRFKSLKDSYGDDLKERGPIKPPTAWQRILDPDELV